MKRSDVLWWTIGGAFVGGLLWFVIRTALGIEDDAEVFARIGFVVAGGFVARRIAERRQAG